MTLRCEAGRCSAPARWFPVLTVEGERLGQLGAGGLAAKVVVCVRCKRSLSVADVLTDRGWRMLQEGAERLGVRLDGGRRAVRLEWASLSAPDDFAREQRHAAGVRQGQQN